MERFRDQTATANEVHHLATIYFHLNMNDLDYDIMDIIDEFNIELIQVDGRKGYTFYNEITRARRKQNNSAIHKHLAHLKAFNSL
jgi:hypothetical protein